MISTPKRRVVPRDKSKNMNSILLFRSLSCPEKLSSRNNAVFSSLKLNPSRDQLLEPGLSLRTRDQTIWPPIVIAYLYLIVSQHHIQGTVPIYFILTDSSNLNLISGNLR